MIHDTINATQKFLCRAIERSGKTQAEIAREAGFERANSLSMMKTGKIRVPIARIPALAAATGVCPQAFLRTALRDYHPQLWSVIAGSFGSVLTQAEQALLFTFRQSDPDHDIAMNAEDVKTLVPVVVDLAERARARAR